jgi:hypothetical protein
LRVVVRPPGHDADGKWYMRFDGTWVPAALNLLHHGVDSTVIALVHDYRDGVL